MKNLRRSPTTQYALYQTLKWIVCLCLLPFLIFAKGGDKHPIYWECAAFDKHGHEWTAKSPYEQIASQRALDACKKESDHPTHCQINTEVCEPFEHGLSLKPIWQCTALDQNGTPWVSIHASSRITAAISAKSRCQKNSLYQESCYVDLITCKNIQKKMNKKFTNDVE